MKKRFSEEQIIGILKEAEAGLKVAELCRKHGVSGATYYNWKAKFGGMAVSDAQRLKVLETENARLKRLLAESMHGQCGLERGRRPKVVGPQAKRAAVSHLMERHQMGVTRACGLIGISRSLYRYEARRPTDQGFKERLCELAAHKRRYGYRRLHVLLCREGWQINRKRTYRVYHEVGLMVCKRKRKRIAGVERQIKVAASAPNESWSMDYVSDGLADGRRLRCLNIVDDFTKECLAIEVATSLPGQRVVGILQRLAGIRGLPRSVTVDNGPEFAGKVLDEWAYSQGLRLSFIQPGKPQQNAYIESFNGKFRDECQNEHMVQSMRHARQLIEDWRQDYNAQQHHSSLGYLTPNQFADSFLTADSMSIAD